MPRTALANLMAERASAWLASLDDNQRKLATGAITDTDERHRWFYTPTDHGGLTLSAMRPAQQRLVFQLVASGLSRAGYVTVSTIIGLDNVLDELEGWVMNWGRERGRDPGMYYARVFGDPVPGGTWSFRFGGHHVSLHHTVVDGAVASVTPCFLGADPASSPLLGPHPLRPLAGAEDYGRELVQSLTADQRRLAILSPVAPVDLVGANRSFLTEGDTAVPLSEIWRDHFTGDLKARVEQIQQIMESRFGLEPHHLDLVSYSATPKGIPGSQLTAPQQQAMRKLLDVYVGRMPDALAVLEADKYAGTHINDLFFMWAGGLEPGIGHYYRIQGPRLWVEYDNSARDANHAHTVWRDPEGDFAHDTLAEHYHQDH